MGCGAFLSGVRAVEEQSKSSAAVKCSCSAVQVQSCAVLVECSLFELLLGRRLVAPPILVSAVCTVHGDREKVMSSGATYSSKRSLYCPWGQGESHEQ